MPSRLPAALLASLAAAGCSAPFARASLRADLEASRAARSLPAPSPFGADAPGIVHCHTRLSHDSPAPLEELVEAARAAGVRWVCLTEHATPEAATDLPRGEVDGVLLIPGEEISRWGGSLLALGAGAHVAGGGRKPAAVAEEIRARGGVALLGHVGEFDRLPPDPADGMAIYDLSGDFRATPILRFPGVLSCVASGDAARAGEAFLLFVQRRPEGLLRTWDAYLSRGPCAGVAETNAHAKFRYLGKTFDPYASLLPLVRNHALVDRVDEAAVLDAVRRGRLLVGFDAAADAGGARFEAFLGDRPAAAMGEALPWSPSLALAVHLPQAGRVRILRDGLPFAAGSGRFLVFPVPGPGVYRMEADLDAGGRDLPWILSNPIRVTPSDGRGSVAPPPARPFQ